MSDRRLLECLVNERLSDFNHYTPIARRLKELRDKLIDDEPLEEYAADHGWESPESPQETATPTDAHRVIELEDQ